MTAGLTLLALSMFGLCSVYVARLDEDTETRDRILSWVLGGAGSLVILIAAMSDGDQLSVFRAAVTALALGALPLGARALYPDGIDLADSAVTAVVGFTVGVTSWGLAWIAMIVAAVIAGFMAALDLIRHNDVERRVPFGLILVTVAIAATALA